MDFITVEQAEDIIRSERRDYGTEEVHYESALGRVLAENLFADRDLPPFNRATADGIAIALDAYASRQPSFKVIATQAAGQTPVAISAKDQCVEIMTGAALDDSVDTVVRYEDIDLADGVATLKVDGIKKGQNIHPQGRDKKRGEKVAGADCIITPALIGLAASIGKTNLLVKKVPRIIIISTGDEMVSPQESPSPYQLRRSNGMMIKSVLARYGISADILHLNDDFPLIQNNLERCLDEYDVLLTVGGASMGKFDYLPQALESLGVRKLFYKVKQRPGKPLWFGAFKNQKLVFAFPGNPVSGFMCLHRYFIPWLEYALSGKPRPPEYAALQADIDFPYPLQYFAQVKLDVSPEGQWLAIPVNTNGSGDFSNLIYTDAFMELPLSRNEFRKEEIYRVWRYS